MNFYNGVLDENHYAFYTLCLYFMESVANRDNRENKPLPILIFNQTIENWTKNSSGFLEGFEEGFVSG